MLDGGRSVKLGVRRSAEMNQRTHPRPAGSSLAVGLLAVALLMSVSASVWLASASSTASRQLKMNREFATQAPLTGGLAGRVALDGATWAPAEGEARSLVLFGAAADGLLGDISFWQDVASLASVESPSIKFVGLCAVVTGCRSPSHHSSVITILSSMDPAQVHALARISERDMAYVYGADGFQSVISIHADKRVLAREIAEAMSRKGVKIVGVAS